MDSAAALIGLIFEDSESDSDIEVVVDWLEGSQQITIQQDQLPTRVENFIEITVQLSSDSEFQSHFRLRRLVFEWLLSNIGPSLENIREKGPQNIDTRKQLLSVLWLLANQESYRSVANRFDMGKSSLFVSFKRVVGSLNQYASSIIKWPSRSEARNMSGSFRWAGLPDVIGAIDGTYIPIKAPKENPEVYVNRKCFHAITLQAICSYDRKFLDVFTGYPSSVSDIRIFRNSPIYNRIIENPTNYFEGQQYIIGDKAYPLTQWCMPPYIDRGNMGRIERAFNKKHTQTRQVIERSFALLFGRFRRLKYLDMNRTDLIPATIIACCVLHNICLDNMDDLETLHLYEQEGQSLIGENTETEVSPTGADTMARNKRDEIARLVNTDS